MFTTDGKREFSELELYMMTFMIWVSGKMMCEFHPWPHVAHGLMVHGDHTHITCRGCAQRMAKNQRDQQEERARWN